jgi:hypothetical protein
MDGRRGFCSWTDALSSRNLDRLYVVNVTLLSTDLTTYRGGGGS